MISEQTALPRFQLFGPEHCDAIHRASLELLRRTGVRVHHQEALALLKDTEAIITDGNLVRFPESLVQWALGQAPSRVTLCRRGTNEGVLLMEGMEVNFGTGSDCASYMDPKTGQSRIFTTPEIIGCIKLVDRLPEMKFCMSMGIPSDVEDDLRYQKQFALMTEYTTKPIVFISGNRRDCEVIHAIAAAAAGGEDELRMNPTLLSYSQATTPLSQPEDSLEKLLFTAEKAIPTVHQPSPMMGGTAPVTLSGAIAVGNAEVLSGMVIQQLKRSGSPTVYGNGVHHLDMKTTISVYGAPEFLLARAAIADMARYYNLPHFGYAGHTDSCIMDEQAASDATSSIMVACLSGQHLVHDIGYMEAGMTFSPELVVFSSEIISMMEHFMKGVAFDPESLALDVLHKLGPGGNHMTSPHTFKHFKELWQPTLFSRDRKDRWISRGSQTLGQRLKDKTVALMEGHQPEPLSDSLKQEIEYILKKK